MEKISVVIPALNEGTTIGNLVASLRRLENVQEVIVVNDGSTDNTAKAAADGGARVITHHFSMGNGAAVKSGLRAATADYVVIIDADGQHRIEDVTRLSEVPAGYDLAVGARPFRWGRFRDFGNLVLSSAATFVSGFKIPDLTSGLRRLHREKALSFLDLYPQGFSFPSTSTILFVSSGYPVTFLPIENIPRPKHASKSKLKPFRDGAKFLTIIYRIVIFSNPLRFFVPLSAICFAFGIGWTVRTLLLTRQVSAAGALSLLSGLTLLLFGAIADQLSQIRKALARQK